MAKKKFQKRMSKELKKRIKKYKNPTQKQWQNEFTKAVKATKMKLGRVI